MTAAAAEALRAPLAETFAGELVEEASRSCGEYRGLKLPILFWGLLIMIIV